MRSPGFATRRRCAGWRHRRLAPGRDNPRPLRRTLRRPVAEPRAVPMSVRRGDPCGRPDSRRAGVVPDGDIGVWLRDGTTPVPYGARSAGPWRNLAQFPCRFVGATLAVARIRDAPALCRMATSALAPGRDNPRPLRRTLRRPVAEPRAVPMSVRRGDPCGRPDSRRAGVVPDGDIGVGSGTGQARPLRRTLRRPVAEPRAVGSGTGQARPLYLLDGFAPRGAELGSRRERPPVPPCHEHLRRTGAPAVLPRWMPSEEFAPRAPVQGPAGTAARPELWQQRQGGNTCQT